MQIDQIEVLVHPDYYQMAVPYMPLHKRQFELRNLWNKRLESIFENKESILIHFSYLSRKRLFNGLTDTSSFENIIELKEVERVENCLNTLGKRFIPFGFLEIPG